MSLFPILLTAFISGALIKLTDDINDKSMTTHRFFAIPGGLAYGFFMGYSMIVDIGASLLFGGIILGCLITGKINSTGHYFGLFAILAVILIHGIKLSPLVFWIGAFSALDESKNIIRAPRSLNFLFDYRLILKIGILMFVIFNILEMSTLIILLAFDLAYILTDYITSRFSNEI